jgi:hypothetical protein
MAIEPAQSQEPKADRSEIGIGDWIRSVPAALRLLLGGDIHLVDAYVGEPLQMSDGRFYVPFRHTRKDDRVPAGAARAVVHPRFALPAMPGRARVRHFVFRHVCIVTTPFFIGLPGFRSKLWMVDPVTGDFAGLYEWDGAALGAAYARGLAKVLRLLSVRGSVTFEVVPDTDVEEYLARTLDEPRRSRTTERRSSNRSTAT